MEGVGKENIMELLHSLKTFEKMYEVVRIVDPAAKQIITLHNNSARRLDTKCFDFWEKGSICENCISMRAFNENQTFVKIEYTTDKVFMVTAVPVNVEGTIYIIELLKDATESMVFKDGAGESRNEIHTLLDNLNNLALKDKLTGIYNRRYIDEKLPVDIINSSLSKRNLSAIMVDIDHFKLVNDKFGHLTGDCVLKRFAGIVSGCLKRESDWAARYGGEEFLVCLPGAGTDKAAEIAENMRSEVEKAVLDCGGSSIKITASFGVCTFKPEAGQKAEALIDCADKKLYAAKNNGRNRVER